MGHGTVSALVEIDHEPDGVGEHVHDRLHPSHFLDACPRDDDCFIHVLTQGTWGVIG